MHPTHSVLNRLLTELAWLMLAGASLTWFSAIEVLHMCANHRPVITPFIQSMSAKCPWSPQLLLLVSAHPVHGVTLETTFVFYFHLGWWFRDLMRLWSWLKTRNGAIDSWDGMMPRCGSSSFLRESKPLEGDCGLWISFYPFSQIQKKNTSFCWRGSWHYHSDVDYGVTCKFKNLDEFPSPHLYFLTLKTLL